MVFLSAGSLVLIAIATVDPHRPHPSSYSTNKDYHYPYFETEAFLRMQLEHAYGQILFALTNHVQTHLTGYPHVDLRSMLGKTTDEAMRRALDFTGMEGDGCGSFLTKGVEVVVGIPPEVRVTISLCFCSCRLVT